MAHPDQWLSEATAELQRSGRPATLRARRLEIEAPWLGDGATQLLHALYLIEQTGNDQRMRAFASAQPLEVAEHFPADPASMEAELEALAAQHGAAIVDLDAPFALEPVTVPKPWGREIWYTGMERRGLSRVRAATGTTPLPWVLALAPRRMCNRANPALLKVLDPLPQPGYGDLYLELHERKQEVYVVTHLDATAWPQGVGRIRLGVDPDKRRRYRDETALREGFLDAVRDYEAIRRRIDAIFDERRGRIDLDPGQATPTELLQAWHAELPEALKAEERSRRAIMDSFTALKPLRVGDVVPVPSLLPHSLQHGVRVVELQTPVYERRIIAFAQKVLTQRHWDSKEAIARMSLEAPAAARFTAVMERADCLAERIASFDDFNAWRVRLAPGAELTLPHHLPYAVCTAIQGYLCNGALTLTAEEACFIPRSGLDHPLVNAGEETAIALLAAPEL